jgi:aspartate racemase
MKTIGMLGGMSWESTVPYYQLVNRAVQDRLGGMHSAKIVMESYDFAEIAVLQKSGRWDEARQIMEETGIKLARAGADFLMICCNTMHLMADAVEQASGLPLLHIADPLGAAIKAKGLKRVGLLGSSFTMERAGVISGRLEEKFGITTMAPNDADREMVNSVIYEELTRGKFLEPSRAAYGEVMARLVGEGAEGIILGCTEIPLLVKPEDTPVPTFDTTTLHAMAAVDLALG